MLRQGRTSFGGRPKAMRGKCERRGGNINADGAGAEVFVGDGCSQGASFGPMVAISRRGQGGRIYNNTRAREPLRRKCVNPRRPHHTFPAESLLPPPHGDTPCPSLFSLPPRADAHPQAARYIPHRRPSPVPAQRHALPEHFLTPFPSTSAPLAAPTHARRPHNTFPAEDLLPSPHSDAPSPSIFSPPSRTLPLPSQRRCTPADLTTFPAEDLRPSRAFSHSLPEHFLTPSPHTSAPPPRDDARPPTPQPIPRRRPSPVPEHFLTPSPPQRTPPRSPDARPPTSRPIPRRRTSPFPQRRPASPSVPLRAQKNGTAQWMCDAECLGRPSLRSVIGVGEPRAVRRRYGALAWRVGLRPQPWALRSRRCGRVLRA